MKWTKEFELQYWESQSFDFYRKIVKNKWDMFMNDPLVRMWDWDLANVAVDIGGGRVGGALRFVRAQIKILLDALYSEFKEIGDLPHDVIGMVCDFSELPIEDGFCDVVFAWNVFDHAEDQTHFHKGMSEAVRITRPNGLFLGAFPLRENPKEGHPLCLTKLMVDKSFEMLGIDFQSRLFSTIIKEPFFRDPVYFIAAKRCV